MKAISEISGDTVPSITFSQPPFSYSVHTRPFFGNSPKIYTVIVSPFCTQQEACAPSFSRAPPVCSSHSTRVFVLSAFMTNAAVAAPYSLSMPVTEYLCTQTGRSGLKKLSEI